MIQLTNEVVDMHRQQHDRQVIKEKLKDIQIIQRMIVEKRAGEKYDHF